MTLFISHAHHFVREVFKARNRKTNQIVALKKVRMENEKEGVSWVHLLCGVCTGRADG